MKKKMKVKDLAGTKTDELAIVNLRDGEIISSLTAMMESVEAELKSNTDAMIESMQIEDEIKDKSFEKEDKLLEFVNFFYSIIFLKDHPLRPFIAEHLKNGTCIQREEGIELFKKYSA